MDRIRCVFLLAHSLLDWLVSDFTTTEEGGCHVEEAVWIAMGCMGS